MAPKPRFKSLTIDFVFDEFAAFDDGERADGDDVEGQGHVGDREAAQDVVHRAADVHAANNGTNFDVRVLDLLHGIASIR